MLRFVSADGGKIEFLSENEDERLLIRELHLKTEGKVMSVNIKEMSETGAMTMAPKSLLDSLTEVGVSAAKKTKGALDLLRDTAEQMLSKKEV